jgi:holo-[acyl-carrier protein] synthase
MGVMAAVRGHGVDVFEIDRIRQILQAHGSRFTERCFTPAERSYAECHQKQTPQRYAVRFACKEAVMKALGSGWGRGVGWRDIEVRRDASGRPSVMLHGRGAEIASELGITSWHVSLSHTRQTAVASVVACGPPDG